MKMKKKFGAFTLNLILLVLSFLVIAPFILTLSISLSNEIDIANFGYKFIPKRIDLTAYKYVFQNPKSILDAYKITAIFSFVSMVLSTLLMAMIAYALTKKFLKGRRFMSLFIYFTMLFNGGLVPSYILITQYLHLDDTIWVYILPCLISPWYVFMMRTFFADLPGEVLESAEIDGANEFVIFFVIALPMSKAVLATIGLFVFLNQWNNWYTTMLYINDESLISLQYLLQRIMKNIELLRQYAQTSESSMVQIKDLPSETAQMAMAIIVAGPALVVFPFFQKYFVKGINVGSVKG